MRALLALLLTTLPAQAWEAGTDGRLCTLTHETPEASARLTYDPAGPLYTITLTTPLPWPDAPVFGIRFDGPNPIFITTDRHQLSEGGRALTVTDQGFGNVLDGLEFNVTATALTGDTALPLSLDGAAPAVAAFRACTTAPSA